MTNSQTSTSEYINEAVALYGTIDTLPGYPSSTHRDVMQITWYALARWGVAPVKVQPSRGHSYRAQFDRNTADVIVRINDYKRWDADAFSFEWTNR